MKTSVRTVCRVLLVAVFAAIFARVSAGAATLVVNRTGDDGSGSCTPAKCTLRDAFLNVHAAIPTEQITFSLPANSTIVLTSGTLPLNNNVVITGPGAGSLTIARSSTAAHFRILDISAGLTVDVSGVTISNGVDDLVESAGAIHNAGTLSLTGCTISGNTGNTEAGAIFNSGTLNINTSTISGNTAAFRGGGVCNSGPGAVMMITNSTISGNSAGNSGGGVDNGGPSYATKLTISNSTISGNTALVGGGIRNSSSDSSVGLSIANSTIAGNSTTGANNGGGGIYNDSTRVCKLFSTIVAKNTAAAGTDLYDPGTATSQGYNLIGNNQNTSMAPTTGDQIGTPGVPIDPLLGPLQDNGGPTQTQALGVNSPAIDKGNSGGLTIDQRGFTRPVDTPTIANSGDGTDIGAYEVQADQLQGCPSTVVANLSDTGAGSLRFVIAGACGGSTITFANNVRGAINLTSGELVLNKNLTINGPGANLLTVQRSAGAATNFRIFHITGNFREAISGLTISNGAGPADASGNKGGGILNSGTLTLTNDAVSLNSAIGGNGGGIYSSGILSVYASTISGNKIDSSTPGSGGGIFNFGGTITVSNSTISGNSAVSPGGTTDHGGGIYSNTGSVTIVSSTITANKADNGGGVLGENGAVFSARSTIIALNTSPNGPDVYGALHSEQYNLIGTNAQATITPNYADDHIGTPGSTIDPLLGALQDNGGPTPTHALQPGSPALDQGLAVLPGSATSIPTDQRGLPRASDNPGIPNAAFGDASDIGAFELQFSCSFSIAPASLAFAASGGNNTVTVTSSTGCAWTAQSNDSFITISGGSSGSGNGSVSYSVSANSSTSARSGTLTIAGQTFTVNQDAAPAPTPTPVSQLQNLSTRKQVGTGDNVLIGGFIVVGTDDKKVLLRGLGPSLAAAGVNGVLADPVLELHKADTTLLAANDNWQDTQAAEISATGIPPSDPAESAIVATLSAQAASQGGAGYTGILAGKGGTTGIGLLEIYDLSGAANSKLANISTRGFVGVDPDLLIGGFIPGPSGRTALSVLVRALGPSLTAEGVSGALQDPVVQLFDGNANKLVENDNWKDASNAAEIQATLPPPDDRESAVITTLAPSNSGYTAVVRGAGGATGVALVEVYALQ